MVVVSKEEVQSLAQLARLALDDSEIECLQEELGVILEHMKLLNEVDTSDVSPMTHVNVSSEQTLRADVVADSLPVDVVIRASHRSENDSFAVPSILP